MYVFGESDTPIQHKESGFSGKRDGIVAPSCGECETPTLCWRLHFLPSQGRYERMNI